jgi:hypothetical protein
MKSHQFMAFGVRGGEGGSYESAMSAAAEVAAAAQATGVTVDVYAQQQAEIAKAAYDERLAARQFGPEVEEFSFAFRGVKQTN